MTQIAAIIARSSAIQVELPDAKAELLRGVEWGPVDAFPSPAYWAFQVLARRVTGTTLQYRLGRSLAEEVGACLLGGHGIPATVGLAAFEHLRGRGAFSGRRVREAELEAWLREPLRIGDRSVHYRFAAQKAHYLASAVPLAHAAPEFTIGLELRDWLLALPGIGHKTASWVARNWLNADDVAILDIHIMRVGQAVGLFPMQMTVERHYVQLEKLFVDFARALDVRPAELDAVIWHEMATSPATVRHLVDHLNSLDEGAHSRETLRKAARQEVALAV
jgi:N-glycosylase/DNA lyase